MHFSTLKIGLRPAVEPLESVLLTPPLTLALPGMKVMKLAIMLELVSTYNRLALISRVKKLYKFWTSQKKKLIKVTN
jgi:hypothetical protein